MSEEINTLVKAFYAAFDNRDQRVPAARELRAMFLADGRVTRISAAGVESWNVDDFIAPRIAMLTDGSLRDFHEWECDSETKVFGEMATRRSGYRKAGTLNGVEYSGEGRKLMQFCRVDDRWRIVSVLWQDC